MPRSAIGLLFLAQVLLGQMVLSQDEIILAKTCGATAEVRKTPVQPAKDTLIVLFGDSITPEEFIRIQPDLLAIYQGLKDKTSLRLAPVFGSQIQFAGPFTSRARLQAALTEVARSLSAERTALPSRPFYSFLTASAHQFGMEWSRAVLVGRFPAAEPEQADYIKGWVATGVGAARIRLSYWQPSGEASDVLDAIVPSTGGFRLTDGLAGLSDLMKENGEKREVSWTNPSTSAGIRACPVTLIGANGQTALTVPAIVAPPGVPLPDLERYANFREKVKALTALVQEERITPEKAAQGEADFAFVIGVSPRDPEFLRLGETLYQRANNDAKLAPILMALSELAPSDVARFAALGHTLFRLRDWEPAERLLLRSRELKPGDADVSEELARIHLARGDDRGALPFLEECLTAKSDSQELWLLRADVSAKIGDWERTADSVEHAIAIGGVSLERRIDLVRLYFQHQASAKALVHLRATAAQLPPEGAVRTEFARYFEGLNLTDESMAAWKRVLDVDAANEPAHERIARILIGQKSWNEALDAAEQGIQACPLSARLFLAKVEILERTDHYYEARRTLRQAVTDLPDPALLARLAEMEDAGGERAAEYYRKLIEIGDQPGALPSDLKRSAALERGLRAAARDGDLANLAWFNAQIRRPDAAPPAIVSSTAIIPGGIAALAFAARTKPSEPERFLVDYARASVGILRSRDPKAVERYRNEIHDHFNRISQLMALGKPGEGKVTVTLAVNDRNAQQMSEKILGLLGWKMQTSRQIVQVEAAEKGELAQRQVTASALAIDEVGMEKNLESGQPFSFDIPVERVPVALGEDVWKAQFYANEKLPGGLVEAIGSNAELALTYAAIGQMEQSSAAALVSSIGLKELADKYSSLLFSFSSSLAVEKGKVTVPGGEKAEPNWTALVGANPGQPAQFFKDLLNKDSGKLLAYYDGLSDLDIQHQRFFTRTPARTAKFYESYKGAPEVQRSKGARIQSGSFREFLSEIPLDANGNVDFPGSPEVWRVAKGESRSTGSFAKMITKLKRAAAPEVEDEILLRLANTRYKLSIVEQSELDNFLAVARIDAHRKVPLDDASALLLAQHLSDDEGVFAYFAILTGLQQKHFEQFFALSSSLRVVPDTERGPRVASLHALFEILCLAQQAGSLTEVHAADLFGAIVERFQKATTPALRTAASLDLVREIIHRAAPPSAVTPDDAMRGILLNSGVPTDVNLGSSVVSVDPFQMRARAYQRVLELQKVPSLATVFALGDAARNLGAGQGEAAKNLQVLQSQAANLFFVEVPTEVRVTGKERGAIEGFQPRRLAELTQQFQQKIAAKSVSAKDLGRLADDYLEEMEAPVRWALTGIVYAYFLDPEDVLVSEDPLLLRKHKFVRARFGVKVPSFETAGLEQTSSGAGSYFAGGLADFGDAAGDAAARNAHLGGEHGRAVAAKQIAALRVTNWKNLRDEDLRLLSLKVAVAKEWIVTAARQPDVEGELAESTLGLLSLTRRADLLASLRSQNWPGVWRSVTLADLYFLADRYLQHYATDPWKSPATVALRHSMLVNDGSRLQSLGGQYSDTFGCSHSHLRSAAPYETFESQQFPNPIAERSAEFKLYLARFADIAGIPAQALGAIAEPAARSIFERMHLSDTHDWRSVLAAYASLDSKTVEEVLAKP